MSDVRFHFDLNKTSSKNIPSLKAQRVRAHVGRGARRRGDEAGADRARTRSPCAAVGAVSETGLGADLFTPRDAALAKPSRFSKCRESYTSTRTGAGGFPEVRWGASSRYEMAGKSDRVSGWTDDLRDEGVWREQKFRARSTRKNPLQEV